MKVLLYFLTSVILLLTFSGYAQKSKSLIFIVDKSNSKPIPFALITLQGLNSNYADLVKTDKTGKVSIEIHGKCILLVNSDFYKPATDTINPGENKYITLIKKSPEESGSFYNKVFNLEEVSITAQSIPTTADKSIYDIKLIDRTQINQKGATTLSQLLANEANIDIIQDNFIGSSNMVIQGLSGEHIKFLIDGVPVIGRTNGNIDLSQLNLNDVDHIEIVEGPMSVQYGSNAIGGAINIITKENKKDKVSSNADIYYESVGQYNINTNLEMKKGNNVFNISGGRNFFGGFKKTDSLRSYLWNPKRDYFLNAYYIYNKKAFGLKYESNYYDQLLLNKGNLEPDFNYDKAWDQYFTTERFNNKAEINYHFSNNKFINFIGAYSIYNQYKKTYLKDLTTLNEVLTSNEGDQDTTKLRSIFLRGEFNKYKDSSKVNVQTGFNINSDIATGKRILGNRQEIQDYAVYATSMHTFVNSFTFQPGIRFAYNTKYNSSVIPSLNLKYNFDEAMVLRASYSRGFRAPEIKELYLYFYDSSHEISGNPNLKPEYSHNFNISVNYNDKLKPKPFFNFEGKLFYNIVNNIITLIPTDPTDTKKWSYINIANFKTIGTNLNFGFIINKAILLNTGYTGTGIFEDSKAERSFSFHNYTYYNNLSSSVNYRLEKQNIVLSVYYKYNGRYPLMYFNADNKLVQGYINSYSNLDFSIMKSFRNDKYQMTIGAKNLLNNINISSQGDVSGIAYHTSASNSNPVNWGRTFFIKISYHFSRE